MNFEIKNFVVPDSAPPSSELLPCLTTFRDHFPELLRPIALLILAQFLSLSQRQPFNLAFNAPKTFREAAVTHNKHVIKSLYKGLASKFNQCPVMQIPLFRFQTIGFTQSYDGRAFYCFDSNSCDLSIILSDFGVITD